MGVKTVYMLRKKCQKGGSDASKGNHEGRTRTPRVLQRTFWKDQDACQQTIALNNVSNAFMMQVQRHLYWFKLLLFEWLKLIGCCRASGGSLNTYSAGGSWSPSRTWRSGDHSWHGSGFLATQSRRLWHHQHSGTCPAHQEINYSYFCFPGAQQSLREYDKILLLEWPWCSSLWRSCQHLV